MLAQLIAALLGNLMQVASTVDQSIQEYRADQNNAAKAHTVAKGVISVVDTVAPIVQALTGKK